MKRRLPVVLATSAFLLMSCNATKDKSKAKMNPVDKKKKETKVVDNKTSEVEEVVFQASCDEAVFKVAPAYILKKGLDIEPEVTEVNPIQPNELLEIESTDLEEMLPTGEEIIPVNVSLKFQNNQDDVDVEKQYDLNGISLDAGDKASISLPQVGLKEIHSDGEEYEVVIKNADDSIVPDQKLAEIDFMKLEFRALEERDLQLSDNYFINHENVKEALLGSKIASTKIETENYEIGLNIREECAGNVEEQIKLAEIEDDKRMEEILEQGRLKRENEARIKAEQEAARLEAERVENERIAAERAEQVRQEKIMKMVEEKFPDLTAEQILEEFYRKQAEEKASQEAAKVRERKAKEKAAAEKRIKDLEAEGKRLAAENLRKVEQRKAEKSQKEKEAKIALDAKVKAEREARIAEEKALEEEARNFVNTNGTKAKVMAMIAAEKFGMDYSKEISHHFKLLAKKKELEKRDQDAALKAEQDKIAAEKAKKDLAAQKLEAERVAKIQAAEDAKAKAKADQEARIVKAILEQRAKDKAEFIKHLNETIK